MIVEPYAETRHESPIRISHLNGEMTSIVMCWSNVPSKLVKAAWTTPGMAQNSQLSSVERQVMPPFYTAQSQLKLKLAARLKTLHRRLRSPEDDRN